MTTTRSFRLHGLYPTSASPINLEPGAVIYASGKFYVSVHNYAGIRGAKSLWSRHEHELDRIQDKLFGIVPPTARATNSPMDFGDWHVICDEVGNLLYLYQKLVQPAEHKQVTTKEDYAKVADYGIF